jgi:hypothetical protein
MRRLLASKLTTLKLVDTLSGPLKEILSDITESSMSDISTSSLTVNINNVENSGFSVDGKVLFLSPALDKEHKRVKALHSFPQDADFVINVSVAIKHEGLAAVQS